MTRNFRVTAPPQAEGEVKSLTARLSSTGVDGAGDLSSTSTISVRGPITLNPSSPVVVGPSLTVPTAITVTSRWNHTVVLHLTPSLPPGVTITPATPAVTVPAHQTVSLKLSVSVAAGQAPATDYVALTPSFTYRRVQYPLAAAQLIRISYTHRCRPRLTRMRSAMTAMSRQPTSTATGTATQSRRLTAAGLRPGRNRDGGRDDVAVARCPGRHARQRADRRADHLYRLFADGATQLDPVCAARAAATESGTGLIEHTDGTTQAYTLTLDNWFNVPDSPSNTLFATAAYVNDSTGAGKSGRRRPAQSQGGTCVRRLASALQPGKTVASVTLPTVATLPGVYPMHVFALGLNSVSTAAGLNVKQRAPGAE